MRQKQSSGLLFQAPDQDGLVLMVAGGIGIAPLPHLAETLVSSGFRGPFVLWFDVQLDGQTVGQSGDQANNQ